MQCLSERDARKRLVAPRLLAAGWNIVRFDTATLLSAYDCRAAEQTCPRGIILHLVSVPQQLK